MSLWKNHKILESCIEMTAHVVSYTWHILMKWLNYILNIFVWHIQNWLWQLCLGLPYATVNNMSPLPYKGLKKTKNTPELKGFYLRKALRKPERCPLFSCCDKCPWNVTGVQSRLTGKAVSFLFVFSTCSLSFLDVKCVHGTRFSLHQHALYLNSQSWRTNKTMWGIRAVNWLLTYSIISVVDMYQERRSHLEHVSSM